MLSSQVAASLVSMSIFFAFAEKESDKVFQKVPLRHLFHTPRSQEYSNQVNIVRICVFCLLQHSDPTSETNNLVGCWADLHFRSRGADARNSRAQK